ncbi:MAG: hypothetical protein ACR2FX_11140 [Chthoniobacterales bacterium]
MKHHRLLVTLALAAAALTAGSARAAVTTLTYQPSPVDLYDLDHHMVYTWRLDNLTVDPNTIAGASLTFNNIRNWDSSTNVLHLHLLDTAVYSGVHSFEDVDQTQVPVVDLTDDFANTRYHNSTGWLVANGTRDTLLGNPSFGTSGTNYTINFTSAELAALQSYIASGHDLAFGMDPDCHFYNNGITFSIDSSPVPEMSATLPIIALLAAAGMVELRRRRRVAAVVAIK